MALQVKYIVYRVTAADWSSPDLGWASCTFGVTDSADTARHRIRLKLMKNLWVPQPSGRV